MSGLQQIRIKIAEKEYTLKIKPEEEALLRRAAKTLNEKTKTMQKKSGIWDKQDLLAMVAFDTMVQNLKYEEEQLEHVEQIKQIEDLLNQVNP
ncbi:MAG: cell division protein ZapA [Flammeovirgaceae bacterium]